MAKHQHRKTARTTQRHRALDVVFEADEKGMIAQDALLDLLKERQKVSTAQVPIGEFGSSIVEAFARNIVDVDTLVEAASEDWALARMNTVDRTILRLGATEILYLDTQRAMIVTEWAALARELSTERSVGFVMGVLNRAADIRARELAQAPAALNAPEKSSGETAPAEADDQG